MSWTYSGDPADSNLDKVRFFIGQTSSGDPQILADEEIEWLISDAANVYYAAAVAARQLGARYAIMAEQESVGQTSISYGNRASKLGELAGTMERKALFEGVSPFAGGVSQTAKDAKESNTDWAVPFARIGQHDYGAGSTST